MKGIEIQVNPKREHLKVDVLQYFLGFNNHYKIYNQVKKIRKTLQRKINQLEMFCESQ
jgi:hypothetical protein